MIWAVWAIVMNESWVALVLLVKGPVKSPSLIVLTQNNMVECNVTSEGLELFYFNPLSHHFPVDVEVDKAGLEVQVNAEMKPGVN